MASSTWFCLVGDGKQILALSDINIVWFLWFPKSKKDDEDSLRPWKFFCSFEAVLWRRGKVWRPSSKTFILLVLHWFLQGAKKVWTYITATIFCNIRTRTWHMVHILVPKFGSDGPESVRVVWVFLELDGQVSLGTWIVHRRSTSRRRGVHIDKFIRGIRICKVQLSPPRC